MKTTTVNIHDAKTSLSRLVPFERPRAMADVFDLYKGQIWIGPDFDAPLPDDVLYRGTTGIPSTGS
jgi:hypothetical protein